MTGWYFPPLFKRDVKIGETLIDLLYIGLYYMLSLQDRLAPDFITIDTNKPNQLNHHIARRLTCLLN